MNISSDPYIWAAAILTIIVFSFLYRDNPAFCFAEHLLVGLSTGYLFCTFWHTVFVPELINPLWEHGMDTEAHLWAAVFLCLLWTGKYVEKTHDLYRLALSFWIAVDLGLQIPTTMEAGFISQITGTINLSFRGAPYETAGNIVLLTGTVAALTYFVFSKVHKGILGGSAKLGTWVLMIGFGATFSYTILSRVYLLIGRVIFLLRDFAGVI